MKNWFGADHRARVAAVLIGTIALLTLPGCYSIGTTESATEGHARHGSAYFMAAGEARTSAAMSGSAATGSSSSSATAAPAAGPLKMVALIGPASASNVHGRIMFTKAEQGVDIILVVDGLTPGMHGFHIHEFGDCSAPDASSAGPHFNPGATSHGGPQSAMHHAGDLGNIEANAAGHVELVMNDPNLTMTGSRSILGRSVIIHEKMDDFTTQPTGNSGSRIGCGVIGLAKSQ